VQDKEKSLTASFAARLLQSPLINILLKGRTLLIGNALLSLQEDKRINVSGILNVTVGSEPPRNFTGLSLIEREHKPRNTFGDMISWIQKKRKGKFYDFFEYFVILIFLG